MSRNYHQLQIVAVVVFSFVLCSHNTYRAHAQYADGEQCRSQCNAAYQFYARFITSSSFLNNYLPSCYGRCPPVYVRPSTTTITTTTMTSTTTTPRYGTCGISNSPRQRIVGGENAGPCEYPWMVAVTVGTYFCGGAILDRRRILTAAHCVRDRFTRAVYNPNQVYVRVGSSQISQLSIRTVANVQIDQRHIPVINDYDVAVLTLTQELVYSACIQPICLPQTWDDPAQTDFCVAAGWGLDSFQATTLQYNLQKVELPIVSNSLCQQSYGTRYVNDLKICAGNWTNGGIDTCQGDSGGPLMCYKNGRYTVYGIVSFGSGCAGPRYPGIYTRVPHQQILGFIRGATGLY